MKTLIAAGTWLLAAAAAAPFEAPAAPRLDLVELSGRIQIRTDVEIRQLGADAFLPSTIPPGSEVSVLSGKAVFHSDGVSIRTAGGDSFAYNLVAEEGMPAGIRLAATGRPQHLLVEIAEATVALSEGSALTVVGPTRGALEVQSLAGYLTLYSLDGEKVLAPGQLARLAEAPPEPASAENSPRIIEPGEVLRSAAGNKQPQPASAEPAPEGFPQSSLGAMTPQTPEPARAPKRRSLYEPPPDFGPTNPACWSIDPRVGPAPQNSCGPW